MKSLINARVWGRTFRVRVFGKERNLQYGDFFDGIVLHQILQLHHMLTSAGYPADTVANLEFDTTLDGLFHTSTYTMTAVGLGLL